MHTIVLELSELSKKSRLARLHSSSLPTMSIRIPRWVQSPWVLLIGFPIFSLFYTKSLAKDPPAVQEAVRQRRMKERLKEERLASEWGIEFADSHEET